MLQRRQVMKQFHQSNLPKMDVMLHKRCAKFIYVIPEGLRELMSDISREVLRSQPEHIYTFVADYLDALMITRENARVAAKLVESITEIGTYVVELLQRTGMSREEADKLAAIIQNAFRKYTATKSHQPQVEYSLTVEEEEEEEGNIVHEILDEYGTYCENEEAAAEVIQKAFRNFRERHLREKDLLTGMIDWRVAARSAIYLYRHSGVTNEEANRAATLIKAAYKGYYTRRVMQRLLDDGQKLYNEQKAKEIQGEYESSEELEFTSETTEDAKKIVEAFVDAVPEDFGIFVESSSSKEKHETVAKILQEITGKFVKSTEENIEISETSLTSETTLTERAAIQEVLDLELEGSEQEQLTVEPLIIEPMLAESMENEQTTESEQPMESEQPTESKPTESEQPTESEPLTISEQPTEIEQPIESEQLTVQITEANEEFVTQVNKEDFTEEGGSAQINLDDVEQTEETEISEPTETTWSPTDATEATETNEN